MTIQRNPDGPPEFDEGKHREARAAGLKRVQIVCHTPEDEPDDPDTPRITFYAYTEFIPRQGEFLTLQDGKRVQVRGVDYTIGTVGKTKFTLLLPVVYAILCRKDEES
jgi:hypothetical protein